MGWMTKVGSISTGDLDLPSTQDGGVPVQSWFTIHMVILGIIIAFPDNKLL